MEASLHRWDAPKLRNDAPHAKKVIMLVNQEAVVESAGLAKV
jgi:hypothetical protein